MALKTVQIAKSTCLVQMIFVGGALKMNFNNIYNIFLK